ncbi:DUF4253 domain-containing protein [Streptomyces sp. NPDC006464]|uniref:DUF4253 domain-containing protein n=1 Tax=Streptomyces sp. NPDC006464 TaxID=3154305 RepID=UPI0033B9CE39
MCPPWADRRLSRADAPQSHAAVRRRCHAVRHTAQQPDAHAAVVRGSPLNYDNDTAKFSAVIHDWEHRFGVRVVAVGLSTLHLSVAAPPVDEEDALLVAAEPFAFCPDNVRQGCQPCTLATYAKRITGSHSWDFGGTDPSPTGKRSPATREVISKYLSAPGQRTRQ